MAGPIFGWANNNLAKAKKIWPGQYWLFQIFGWANQWPSQNGPAKIWKKLVQPNVANTKKNRPV